MLRNDIAPTIALDGAWDFALGEEAPWGQLLVPGCWEAQGYAKAIDGPARYRREVFIPAEWAGRRVLLEFDAVSYACTVRCNGTELGTHLGMWTPFAFELGSAMRPGEWNTIALECYKPGQRYPVRECLAGFLPDVATTFGGIWQPARLRLLDVALADLQINPDPATGSLQITCMVDAAVELVGASCCVEVFEREQTADGRRQTADGSETAPLASAFATLDSAPSSFILHPSSFTLTVPDPQLWDLDRPVLYTVRVRVLQGDITLAEATEQVGFRRLEAVGEQVRLNGRPLVLRGALSWGWDPDLLAPNFTHAYVRDELRRVRELGFNMVKLCLFVPSQAYYQIADEEGVLLWQEWPIWLPTITPALRERAPVEYEQLMRLTRHHPSVVLYSVGCEMNVSVKGPLLERLTSIVRAGAAGALVCDNSGSGEAYGGLQFDFADFADYHTYGEVQHFEPLLDNWRRGWQPARPWIFGEFCDCDGFRDRDALVAANGGSTPWWLTEEIPVRTWRPEVQAQVEAPTRLAAAEVGFSNEELLRIAAAQALVVRKFWLEACRRRPEIGGYVVTGLRDTPIATSGLFDDFGQSKATPAAFRAFNDDAVLCLDTGRRRRWLHEGERVEPLDRHCWWAGAPLRLHVILSHSTVGIGAADAQSPIPNPQSPLPWHLSWRIETLDGAQLASQEADCRAIAPGVPREVAVIDWTPPALQQAQELRLHVRVRAPGLTVENSWPLWVFPEPRSWPQGLAFHDPAHMLDNLELQRIAPASPAAAPRLVIASELNNTLHDYMRAGGRVLLLQQGTGPLPARHLPFWREALKLFPPHPLWERFPTQGYADMQFFGLAGDVALDARRLHEALPEATAIQPIMRRLDARHLHMSEYLLEARVGSGLLLACTLRLQGGAGGQPWGPRRHVAGWFLLHALVDYLIHRRDAEEGRGWRMEDGG